MAHAPVSLHSLKSTWQQLPPATRQALIQQLDPRDAETLLYDWDFWARAEQLAPAGTWFIWLLLAGRGWGKTRTGAEWIRSRVESGNYGRIALIGQTAADVRDVIIEGESGLLAVSHPQFMPKYEPSKRRVTWPNGAIATTYSGDEPDQLRGPQHDTAWCDELAKWKYAQLAFDNLEFGLRLGPNPQVAVTTTPRPIPLIKAIKADTQTVSPTTNLSTYVNVANVSPKFIQRVIKKYEGTRLGRQELNAEILEDTPGALWKRDQIEALRVRSHPDLVRIVVAVDPPATSEGDEAAEAGIIVAGVGTDGHGYVLDDSSQQGTPSEWASAAITAYHKFRADRIVAERNNGGDMVGHTIHSVEKGLPVTLVWASRGKQTRAEPVSALYEQKRIHHVGSFAQLEDQMCTWVPGMKSPDRMDALVWAITELLVDVYADDEDDQGSSDSWSTYL
jgi:phage terminase large subunit-like protein